MVRDNLGGPPDQSPTCAAETHNQSAAAAPVAAATAAAAAASSQPPPRPASPPPARTESPEPGREQPSRLNWSKFCISEEELHIWCQSDEGPDNVTATFPTHLRLFSSPAQYQLVKHTYQQLLHSGYYWGPMTMETAHRVLVHTPPGTFLIRDSGQTDVFFTLSYHSKDGPTSVRVLLRELLFNLYGSSKTFASLFALLAYYTSAACKLTRPYRRQRPERLKEICRRAVVRAHGGGALAGVAGEIKDYVEAYPYCI